MNKTFYRREASTLWMLFVLTTALFAQESSMTCFVKHSSGLVLGVNSEGRAAIFESNDSSLRPLSFIPAEEDYYNIALVNDTGEYTYLSLSGSWNTYFLSDPETDNAKYRIVGDTNGLLMLQCKANDKFLGTDGTEAGAHVYSDKNGSSTLHTWFLTNDINEEAPQIKTSYILNPHALLQQNEGWGVSLCWWANMCGKWSDEKIDELVDWLVSPNGLNYNIFRYNIGGGDDPQNTHCDLHHMGNGKGLRAEMEGFKDSTNGDYIWTRDAGQRKIMLKIKKKRPDAIFEAFSNSAPYYMTYSGCVAGNTNAGKDNLRPEYYEEFAHYLVDICKHYKEVYGIEFKTLEPFNEAMTSYWGANGGQEGCHFDKESQVAFLKVLAPILKESGLSTYISASDETSVSSSIEVFKHYEQEGILNLVGQWNTHTYSASNSARARIGTLARHAGMKLWMSETGSGGSGITGNLNMAQRLIDDVRYIMPDAWVDWQYVEEWNDQWCLVRGNFEQQTYWKVKNYYVRQQFTKFIKQGYTFITTMNEQTLAAINPTADTLVMVALNASGIEETHTANLIFAQPNGMPVCYRTSETEDVALVDDFTLQKKELQFTLPPLSVATFIIPISLETTADNTIREGNPYLICPQYNATLALTAGETVTIEAIAEEEKGDSLFSSSQAWTFSTVDGESYRIKSKNGAILTAQLPEYPLTVSDTETNQQTFYIVPVEGIYAKIVLTENPEKAFDLNNEAYTKGTVVGLWDYGTSVSAGHRNWHIISLPADEETGIGPFLTSSDLSRIARIKTEPRSLTIYLQPEVTEALLNLYSLNGTKVFSYHLQTNLLHIPLQQGIYIIELTTGTHTEHIKIPIC